MELELPKIPYSAVLLSGEVQCGDPRQYVHIVTRAPYTGIQNNFKAVSGCQKIIRSLTVLTENTSPNYF